MVSARTTFLPGVSWDGRHVHVKGGWGGLHRPALVAVRRKTYQTESTEEIVIVSHEVELSYSSESLLGCQICGLGCKFQPLAPDADSST